MKANPHQKMVIREVLQFLSRTIDTDFNILGYPDETERNSPACDALAIVGNRNIAVEHTSIDSIPNQRRDNSRFIALLGPLEKELAGKLPSPGHYNLVVQMKP